MCDLMCVNACCSLVGSTICFISFSSYTSSRPLLLKRVQCSFNSILTEINRQCVAIPTKHRRQRLCLPCPSTYVILSCATIPLVALLLRSLTNIYDDENGSCSLVCPIGGFMFKCERIWLTFTVLCRYLRKSRFAFSPTLCEAINGIPAI